MLDHEPDTNDQNDTTDQAPDDSDRHSAPPPRRRRAASRPAGPPAPVTVPETPPVPAPESPTAAAQAEVSAPGTVQSEAPAPESPQPEEPAPESPQPEAAVPVPEAGDGDAVAPATKTVKRAPAKRVTSKRTASADAGPATAEDPAAEAATATRRRRTTKKAAAVPLVSDPFAIPDPFAVPDPFAAAEEAQPAPEPTAEDEPAGVEPSPAEPVSEVRDETATEPLLEPAPETVVEEWEDTASATEPQGDAEEETEGTDELSAGEDAEGASRRRRRRRGGRRRRRGGEGDGPEDGAEAPEGPAETGAEPGEAAELAVPTEPTEGAEGAEGETEGDEGEGGQRRRRRRRRRRGEDSGTAADDPSEVVVRVREPRAKKKVTEVTGIDGSTRMEAKRQRRREGREAGRRRPPILSEAEFLARREAVERAMVVRQREDLTQIAVLEDGILVEHYVDRDSAASLIGNVYLGRVQNVLPSMEAAFVDIGRGRNAVLYAGEVDWDSFGAEGQARKVEKVLKSGQSILVQVTKDPVGAKGARLTNHVSIPGRYLVYAPGGHLSGISRKLPDTERKRLKDILADLVGESASVIVRTAAEGASEDELVRDVTRLKAQWDDIEKKIQSGSAPKLLYGEPDLTVRIVRDLFTEDFGSLVIQGNDGPNDAYDAVEAYVNHVAPHLAERLSRFTPTEEEPDLFARHRLDEQIAKALERKVFLPSGGSLVIDRTEAMTVIDVNTGKFTGSGGNLEATVTSNNLEAAEEIVRQLRLRDIGGIIVIDFIDMVLPNNRELLLRRLVECLGRDRTRHQVAEVTSLGLVQLTRKKIGTGLLEAFSTECPTCHGRGYELHDEPVESQSQPDGGARTSGRDRPRGPSRPRTTSGPNGGSQPTATVPSPADLAPSGAGGS